MRLKVLLAAAAMVSLATVGAKADTVQFTVVSSGSGAVLTFDVPESPTPTTSTSTFFEIANVSISYNGTPVKNTDNILFYTATGNVETIGDTTGFFYDTLGNILTTGAYFTGTTAHPTFVPGTYGIKGDSVTITDISTVAAVPEASTWAMLLLGFASVGFLGYRKKAAVRFV